ncbi:MAG: class I SAM-dependent methyltransferase, partial [Patescibacteria group bacterium]
MDNAKHFIESLLETAYIKINGIRAWDLRVNDYRVFNRVMREGSLGFGEAYMDGWWETDALDEMLTRIFRAKLEDKVRSWKSLGFALSARLFNPQRKAKAFEIGEKHYDIGNGLYRRMLDSRMVYTCGYFQNATTLDEAQEAKLDLVCQKIGLKSGMRVLDIGCGWGSFAKFAAEKYGASVVGITVSKEQVALGRERCAGLPVELRLQDYRDVDEKVDRV